ncbi:MAG: hypothetical protein V1860_00795, partial [bacterium]
MFYHKFIKNTPTADTAKKEENNHISLSDASKYSRYSQEYLSLRARQGKLQAIKDGRNWVTTKEWIDEYEKKFGVSSGNIGKISDMSKRLFSRKAFAVAAVAVFLIAAVVFGKEIGPIGQARQIIGKEIGNWKLVMGLPNGLEIKKLRNKEIKKFALDGIKGLATGINNTIGKFGEGLGQSYIGLSREIVKIAGGFGEAVGESYIGLNQQIVEAADGFGNGMRQSCIGLSGNMFNAANISGMSLDKGRAVLADGITYIGNAGIKVSGKAGDIMNKAIVAWKNVITNIPKDENDFNALVKGNRDWKLMENGDMAVKIPLAPFAKGGTDLAGKVAGAVAVKQAAGDKNKQGWFGSLVNGGKDVLNFSGNLMGIAVDGFSDGMEAVVKNMDSAMGLVFGNNVNHNLAQTSRINLAVSNTQDINSDSHLDGDAQDENISDELSTPVAETDSPQEDAQDENEQKEDTAADSQENVAVDELPAPSVNTKIVQRVVEREIVKENNIINKNITTYNAIDNTKLSLTGGTITGDLMVLGNTKVNELSAASILNGGTLINTGEAQLNGGVRIGSGLLTAGTSEALDRVNIGGGLVVTGNTQLAGVTINGAETINGQLIVSGQIQTSGINVSGFATANNLSVAGHIQAGTLGVSGDFGINKSLFVTRNATLGSNASDTLLVNGASTFAAGVSANRGLNVEGANFTVGGSNFVVDTSGNVTVAGNLTVSGNNTTGGTLSVTGGMTFDNASSTMLTLANNFWSNGTTSIGDADADILNIRSGVWNITSTATTTVAMTKGINFDSGTFVIDPNSGRVGIGTSSPRVLLHVGSNLSEHIFGSEDMMVSGASEFDGTSWFDGSLRASSTLMVTGAANLYNDLTVNSGVQIGASPSAGHITALADNSLIAAGQSEFDGTSWFDGSLRASSTLMVTGAVRLYNTLLVDGSFAASSTAQITGAVNLYSTLNVAGNTTMSNASSTMLTVANNLWSNGATNIGDADTDILNIRSGVWNLTSTATTTVAMTKGINFDSDTFVIDPNSGRVGIGTSSPFAVLSVNVPTGINSFAIGSSTGTFFLVDANGNVEISRDLTLEGNLTVIGNTSSDTVTINSAFNSDIIPNLNAVNDIGSAAYFWDYG